MEFTELTADQLDEVISESEREVARARARQLGAIREQRRRKTHESDGYRSMVDWVAAGADELTLDDRLPVAERRALALIAICQDSLYEAPVADASAPALLTVTIDGATAVPTGGRSGVSILSGPRIGREALDALVCDAIVEVTVRTEEGVPLNNGRRSRTVPPQLRRTILDRDGGCTVAGCTSRYRLEAHHAIPWSKGGRTDADNLITLCWFHHHVVVHRWGYPVDRVGTSLIRLSRPDSTDHPP